MAKSELNVASREGLGKGAANRLRAAGRIPAVIYGQGVDTTAVSVDPKALAQAIATEAGWNTLITLRGVAGVEGKVVILKDLQRHAIRRDMTHADFQVVNLKQKVHVMVPVHTVGVSAGQKNGGLVEIIRHELEVVCLPTAIPAAIEIDVTGLNIGGVIHINDIALPQGVEAPHDVNFTVITCVGRKAEVETAVVEEAAATPAP